MEFTVPVFCELAFPVTREVKFFHKIKSFILEKVQQLEPTHFLVVQSTFSLPKNTFDEHNRNNDCQDNLLGQKCNIYVQHYQKT